MIRNKTQQIITLQSVGVCSIQLNDTIYNPQDY